MVAPIPWHITAAKQRTVPLSKRTAHSNAAPELGRYVNTQAIHHPSDHLCSIYTGSIIRPTASRVNSTSGRLCKWVCNWWPLKFLFTAIFAMVSTFYQLFLCLFPSNNKRPTTFMKTKITCPSENRALYSKTEERSETSSPLHFEDTTRVVKLLYVVSWHEIRRKPLVNRKHCSRADDLPY